MSILPTFRERILHRLHLLPTPIFDAFASVLLGRALCVAVRRGFFEVLDRGASSLKLLADGTGLSEEGTRLLADSFVVAGYVHRRGENYVIAREAKKWLVRTSPDYLGNLVGYFETLHGRWGALEHSLERGKPERPYYELFGDDDWKLYVYGMRDLARLLLPHVIGKIELPPDPHTLLDVGGSHGFYSIELCRKYAGLRAVVLDFEPALRHTTALVREEGMAERVELQGGDFLQRPFPQGVDGILLFNVIHGFTEEQNIPLVRKAIDALKPGGRLYILDQLTEPGKRRGAAGLIPLMVGLNLLNEIGGKAYSFEQVRRWCEGASSVRLRRLGVPGVSLLEVIR